MVAWIIGLSGADKTNLAKEIVVNKGLNHCQKLKI